MSPARPTPSPRCAPRRAAAETRGRAGSLPLHRLALPPLLRPQEGGRRFITVDDLLHALRKLGLGMYADAVGGLANLPPAEKWAASACPTKPTAVAFSSPVSSNKRACAWVPSRPLAAPDLNEAFDGKRPKRSVLDELALGAPGAEETRPPPSGPRADAAEAASAIEQRQIESMLAADPGLLNN